MSSIEFGLAPRSGSLRGRFRSFDGGPGHDMASTLGVGGTVEGRFYSASSQPGFSIEV